MKKWMTLLLCCVLALNLTACGAGAPGGPEDNAPPVIVIVGRAAAGERAAL